VTDQIIDYADTYALGIAAPILERRAPAILLALIDSEEIRGRSLIYFHDIIMDRKRETDDQEVLLKYRRQDMPRRLKKHRRTPKKKPR